MQRRTVVISCVLSISGCIERPGNDKKTSTKSATETKNNCNIYMDIGVFEPTNKQLKYIYPIEYSNLPKENKEFIDALLKEGQNCYSHESDLAVSLIDVAGGKINKQTLEYDNDHDTTTFPTFTETAFVKMGEKYYSLQIEYGDQVISVGV